MRPDSNDGYFLRSVFVYNTLDDLGCMGNYIDNIKPNIVLAGLDCISSAPFTSGDEFYEIYISYLCRCIQTEIKILFHRDLVLTIQLESF